MVGWLMDDDDDAAVGGGQDRVLTMRSASALRFSNGCSSLNLDRIVDDLVEISVAGGVSLVVGDG